MLSLRMSESGSPLQELNSLKFVLCNTVSIQVIDSLRNMNMAYSEKREKEREKEDLEREDLNHKGARVNTGSRSHLGWLEHEHQGKENTSDSKSNHDHHWFRHSTLLLAAGLPIRGKEKEKKKKRKEEKEKEEEEEKKKKKKKRRKKKEERKEKE
jgi:hypothetical protein